MAASCCVDGGGGDSSSAVTFSRMLTVVSDALFSPESIKSIQPIRSVTRVASSVGCTYVLVRIVQYQFE
jgi:hypothetical protein